MTQLLTAQGRRLEWRHWGPSPEDAPTIALLHEGLGCLALWRDFPERLAAATGLGVMAWSRAGYGRSDPIDLPRPMDYLTREATLALPQVLAATGFRRGVLMGHSDGGTIAAEYAGRVDDPRVRGIVVMAPHFFTERAGLAEIAVACDAYRAGGLKARLAKYHAHPDVAFHGWADTWQNPDFADWNIEDVLDRLRVPVLAIQGKGDQYATLRQIEVIRDRAPVPVELLALDDCRHAPHQDQPERVLAAVAGFCARLDLD